MLITKKLIKFNNLIIKIPNEMKGIWDLSENRWGYKNYDIDLKLYKRIRV